MCYSCLCTSINEVAIHGIPSSSDILHSGDLVSVDVAIFTGTAHGDACETFLVLDGNPISIEEYTLQKHLLFCAKRACDAGISVCGPGVKFSAIAKAISQEVFECGCRVIAGVGGHGIGEFFHGPPYVAHSVFEKESKFADIEMRPGHVFTIEPAVAAATVKSHLANEITEHLALPAVSKNGWSVCTTDCALTAQFEETILITPSGVDILTH